VAEVGAKKTTMTSSTEPKQAPGFAWPIDHPWWTTLVLAAIIIFIGYALPRAHIDFSLEQLYPQNSELARVYKEHKAAYGADDNSFFAVREGSAWAPELEQAEQDFRSLPQIDNTISPFTMERLVEREGVLEMRPLQPADADVLTRGTVLSVDDSAGAIIVRVAEPHNNHDGREALLTEVERIIEAVGGEWHLAGMPVIRTAYVRLVLTDLRVLVPLSILIAGFFFVLSFRDTRQVLLGLLSISLGMLASAAVYVMAGGVVNTFSPAFFSVVIVVGTSDLIHLVHRFSDHVDEMGPSALNVKEAARRAAREIGFACLLTTTTTAIGFLALVWTDLPTVQMFGMGAGAGVMVTYFITFLVVPPCLARLRAPSRAAQTHAVDGGIRMRKLGRWVIHRRKKMLSIFAVVAIVLSILGSRTEVAYRLLADLGSSDAGTSQLFMEEHMGAVLPMSVDIRFDGDARDPEALAAIDTLTAWVREQPLVGQATSLADLTRESWETLSGKPGTMPPTREAAAQSLFMLSMAEEDPVPSIMLDDGKRTRILMRVKDEGGAATIGLTERLEAKAKEILAPVGGEANVTGVAYVVQWINRTLTQQFVGSFGIALLLIGTAWMVTTRSLRRVAVALIPNILPLLAVLAALGATGIPLKPTTAMVFSIGLGIAVDDTIHFLAAYERWRKQHPGCRPAEAVEHAYATAGRSMLDTSIVLTAGMMAMAASEFTGFLYLGGFTAWSVVAALITDLLLLGPLLVVLDDR
jgi:predicted RND superfamily exporter protein